MSESEVFSRFISANIVAIFITISVALSARKAGYPWYLWALFAFFGASGMVLTTVIGMPNRTLDQRRKKAILDLRKKVQG